MLHSDWFSFTTLVSANVSFSDAMQGGNVNIKVLLGIASFTDYIAIYLIYHCIIVFCPYNKTALYNNDRSGNIGQIHRLRKFMLDKGRKERGNGNVVQI